MDLAPGWVARRVGSTLAGEHVARDPLATGTRRPSEGAGGTRDVQLPRKEVIHMCVSTVQSKVAAT